MNHARWPHCLQYAAWAGRLAPQPLQIFTSYLPFQMRLRKRAASKPVTTTATMHMKMSHHGTGGTSGTLHSIDDSAYANSAWPSIPRL